LDKVVFEALSMWEGFVKVGRLRGGVFWGGGLISDAAFLPFSFKRI